MNTTLLILAAGMGSRYGGLKQLDAIGPQGQAILEYSVYDAIKAGFSKIVFVIRKDFEVQFKDTVATRFASGIKIEYAFQSLNDLPDTYKFKCPNERTKPWGTAQAIWASRNFIQEPFAVINADDFYGRDAFEVMHDYCQKFAKNTSDSTAVSGKAQNQKVGLITYALENTLSSNGTVNRGICAIENAQLKTVEEHSEIQLEKTSGIKGKNSLGQWVSLDATDRVSMNFWGFSHEIFSHIESFFSCFLEAHGAALDSECYLPDAIDSLIQKQIIQCEALETNACWLGITYPEDKAFVKAKLSELNQSEVYFQ